MTDFEQLLSVPSTLREHEPEIDQHGLDRYDYLMINHATFDDRQEFHVLMDLIMDVRVQASLRSGVNYSDFYKCVGNSPERIYRVPESISWPSQILNTN
jgi:hypothetical protein